MDLSGRPEYFETLHADSADPWQVCGSWYEERKAQLLMSVLPRRRYSRCCEPGSSIGTVTERLAKRCDEVVATDVSASALVRLRGRMPEGVQVVAELMSLPDLPSGTFDLLVLSEVLNYLSVAALDELLARIPSALQTQADVVLVHRMKSKPGQPVTVEAAHDAFSRLSGLEPWTEIRDRNFLMSCFRWLPGEVSDDDPPRRADKGGL